MYFLDTNISLELELRQERAADSRELLQKLEDCSVECLTTDFHVYAGALVVQRNTGDARMVEEYLARMVGYDNLTLYRPIESDWLKATECMRACGLDFDDALAVQSMKANDIKEIISYDRDFDRAKDIKRVEPGDVP